MFDFSPYTVWKELKKASRGFVHTWWCLILSFTVALIAPEDILSSFPFLADYFVNPVSSLVSFVFSIQLWAAFSGFPEVTSLVFAMLYVMLSIESIHCLLVAELPRYVHTEHWSWLLFGLIVSYLATLIGIFIPEISLLNYVDPSVPPERMGFGAFLMYMTVESAMTCRIVFGLLAPFLICCGFAVLVNLIVWHKYVFFGIFRKTR